MSCDIYLVVAGWDRLPAVVAGWGRQPAVVALVGDRSPGVADSYQCRPEVGPASP